MSDTYLTIAKEARVQIKVKDSKFIATTAPVENEAETEEFITQVSKEFYDATHNVSAYRVGLKDIIQRYSDDGEPAGSSGPPVLQMIEGADLLNTAVVVTRYFGGTKLGYGGLVRAYGDAAQAVLQAAGSRKWTKYLILRVDVPYDQMGSVINSVQGGVGEIRDTQFSNAGVGIIVDLLPEYFKRFEKRVIDATRGKAVVHVEKEEYRG